MSNSGPTHAFTRGEARALKAAAENERDALLLDLLDHTGGRISEVLALRPADIIADDALRLKNEKQSEQDAIKVVYLPDAVVDQLRAYIAAQHIGLGQYVFAGKSAGRHLTRQAVWYLHKRLSRKVGLIRIRRSTTQHDERVTGAWAHLWRHTFAVNAVQDRVSIVAIQDQLGHASLASTQVYAKMFDPDRRDAVKAMRF